MKDFFPYLFQASKNELVFLSFDLTQLYDGGINVNHGISDQLNELYKKFGEQKDKEQLELGKTLNDMGLKE